MENNESSRRVTGTCSDYTHDGKGVVKIDKMPIFVPNLLTGETAEIVITEKKASFSLGRVTKRLSDSTERVVPPCPYYEDCGGCQLQHMSYKEQIRMKKMRVSEVLRRLGDYNGPVQDIISIPNPWHYRNKIQMPFGKTPTGQFIAGLYAEGTHEIIDVENCLIENAEADAIVKTLKTLFTTFHVEPYNAKTQKGWIRYVLIRKGAKSGQLMVVLISGKGHFPQRENIINGLYAAHPNITTLVQNVNGEYTNVVLGQEEIILKGPGFIEDTLSNLKFKIAPKSFFQVNPEQTEKLYSKAIELADIKPTDTVLDAYCGVGTIALFAAKKAKHVHGVELVMDAVLNARTNASLNGIKNVEFECTDATKFMVYQAEQKKTFDVLFVDPPRNGCDPAFLNAVLTMKPKRMVYISCEPSSLARDLKILQSGYVVKYVQPVDMFSQTYHVETVVLLELIG